MHFDLNAHLEIHPNPMLKVPMYQESKYKLIIFSSSVGLVTNLGVGIPKPLKGSQHDVTRAIQ